MLRRLSQVMKIPGEEITAIIFRILIINYYFQTVAIKT